MNDLRLLPPVGVGGTGEFLEASSLFCSFEKVPSKTLTKSLLLSAN